ncbi:putative pre-mRNA-splicing factor [Suhomyces tanzawaensis NRRL Y-17324]|uniref:Putative pre-mRNA-splicing factor n=1 Tax=Suhomyces tanzawaensis NRRL Y-17324 TaxID=984487 RepID=A0A1E4SQ45_9ASCO|nr:putative pre-mRNA-splicing factor [Suhomyces tanzawaensis NRRL Y-17324]ODV81626.1 putative pre-mRNA-splicing factor [Suhomyces tanzawaensis NRRL Y-17324]
MFPYIESQRSKLEEIDAIESNIAKRFKRNPYLLPESRRPSPDILTATRANKRSQKESVLQQHEIKRFVEKYSTLRANVLGFKEKNELFQEELTRISDPKLTFSAFDEALELIKQKHEQDSASGVLLLAAEDINKVYAPYSGALLEGNPAKVQRLNTFEDKEKVRVKKRYIISEAAANIDVDQLFTSEEEFGKFLDLLFAYELYKQHLNTEIASYVEFTYKLNNYPLMAKNEHFDTYLHQIVKYLEQFIVKTNPLLDTTKLLGDLYSTFEPGDVESLKTPTDELFCVACQKTFTKATVYEGHLSGKKHKKNVEKSSQKSENNRLYLQFQLDQLLKHLSPVLDATRNNATRKEGMTEREKMIEETGKAGDESEYTTVNSSDSEFSDSDSDANSDEDEYENYKDLPLGADGTPIPFWLFKLQGLNKSYQCQICGNISYKGRMAFDKHFSSAKHQHGLRFLGITDEFLPLFKSIVDIEEAIDLWKKIKRDKRIDEGEVENAVEVEDEDGNVMSEKDYLELERQGLL